MCEYLQYTLYAEGLSGLQGQLSQLLSQVLKRVLSKNRVLILG